MSGSSARQYSLVDHRPTAQRSRRGFNRAFRAHACRLPRPPFFGRPFRNSFMRTPQKKFALTFLPDAAFLSCARHFARCLSTRSGAEGTFRRRANRAKPPAIRSSAASAAKKLISTACRRGMRAGRSRLCQPQACSVVSIFSNGCGLPQPGGRKEKNGRAASGKIDQERLSVELILDYGRNCGHKTSPLPSRVRTSVMKTRGLLLSVSLARRDGKTNANSLCAQDSAWMNRSLRSDSKSRDRWAAAHLRSLFGSRSESKDIRTAKHERFAVSRSRDFAVLRFFSNAKFHMEDAAEKRRQAFVKIRNVLLKEKEIKRFFPTRSNIRKALLQELNYC